MTILLSYIKRIIALISILISTIGINTKSVSVDLFSNPSTGYSWEYSMDKPSVLVLSDSYYTRDLTALSGNGGEDHFIFKAVKQGEVKITFKYVKHNNTYDDVNSEYNYYYSVDSDGKITLLKVE